MTKLKLFTPLWIILLIFAGSAQAQLPDFVPLIEAYSPAVVNISTTQKPNKNSNIMKDFKGFGKEFPFEGLPDMFKHFFEREFKQNFIPQRGSKVSSLGSGMIISQDGYIMTNHHVVNEADEIIVRLKDRREFKAKVIGSDAQADTALIKIEASNLPTVKIGKSKNLKVGEWVFAIGSPFGFDLSASAGIVSAKGRSVPGENDYNYVPFIQTDVAINPGNSGGPLFNLEGEVVGMNSMIYSKSGGYMGVSFSIPIDVAMNVVDQLRNSGQVVRGWLGILIQPITYDLAESFGMKKPMGSLVAKILPDSPAEKSELRVGDVVLKFNGEEITKNSDLPPIVARVKVGTSAPLEVLREGKRKTINVVIGALPVDKKKLATTKSMGKEETSVKIEEIAGMTLAPVSDKLREQLKIEEGGVLIEAVTEDSGAAASGIIAGDVIMKLEYKTIDSVEKFKTQVQAMPKGKSVPAYIIRRSGPVFLAYKK